MLRYQYSYSFILGARLRHQCVHAPHRPDGGGVSYFSLTHDSNFSQKVLRYSDSMIYFASIVRRELDGLKSHQNGEVETINSLIYRWSTQVTSHTRFKARRANRTVLTAIRRSTIATQTVEEEQEAKRRWAWLRLLLICWLIDYTDFDPVAMTFDIAENWRSLKCCYKGGRVIFSTVLTIWWPRASGWGMLGVWR